MCVARPMLANCFLNAKVSRLVLENRKNCFPFFDCVSVWILECIWSFMSNTYSRFVPSILDGGTGKIVDTKCCKMMRKDSWIQMVCWLFSFVVFDVTIQYERMYFEWNYGSGTNIERHELYTSLYEHVGNYNLWNLLKKRKELKLWFTDTDLKNVSKSLSASLTRNISTRKLTTPLLNVLSMEIENLKLKFKFLLNVSCI